MIKARVHQTNTHSAHGITTSSLQFQQVGTASLGLTQPMTAAQNRFVHCFQLATTHKLGKQLNE